MPKPESHQVGLPRLYGATTMGERGQIVIPAEARRDLQMSPSSKLLVFGNPKGGGLLIMKVDDVGELVSQVNQILKSIESVARTEPATAKVRRKAG